MLSRALRISTPASFIRGFCASPQAAEVVKEVVDKVQTNEQAQAAIIPEELLKRVVGTSRVPAEVRVRLLVIYYGQQQAQQEAKALYQSLHQAEQAELWQKLESQHNELSQEISESTRWESSASYYQHLTDLRTQEVLELTGRMHLKGLLEYAEIDAKRFGAPTNKGRTGLWKWILETNPKLVACITSGTTWKENITPVKIQSLYDTLSKNHHVGKAPVETALEGLII